MVALPVSSILKMLGETDLLDEYVILFWMMTIRHPVITQHHNIHVSWHPRLVQPRLQMNQRLVKLKIFHK